MFKRWKDSSRDAVLVGRSYQFYTFILEFNERLNVCG